MLKFDLTVVGGGAAGLACAYIAAKHGLKTLLVEKQLFLGGLMTLGQVIPVMKTCDKGINIEFYRDLIKFMRDKKAQITYCDSNEGWFNPELLKIYLPLMLKSVGVKILSDSKIVKINKGHKCKVLSRGLSVYFETNYFVDATGNGNFSCEFFGKIFLPKENFSQAESMRFILGEINSKKFVDFLKNSDDDGDISTFCNVDGDIYFSTSYTRNSEKSKVLKPLFEKAVAGKVLKPSDGEYFQMFSVPKMPGCVSFNCPRIYPGNTPFDRSEAYIAGGEQIIRYINFCKDFLPGFENCFLSSIATVPGLREESRVQCEHVFSEDDILSDKIPENPAFASDYPFDIHGKKNVLEKSKNSIWYMPFDTLRCTENLFVVGRCMSATMKAHSAARTQKNCFSAGESVAKYLINLKNHG